MKNATNRTKYRRCWAVFGNRSEGLLVRAEPLGLARRLCQRMVEVVHETDGALLLAADPAWAAAINTVLVMKGLRISELRRVGDLPTIYGLPRGRRAERERRQNGGPRLTCEAESSLGS
jgi:hypothetical protein